MTKPVAERILDSLYRVVVPLPNSPLKEVNCYVLAEEDRFLVIDTGMNRPECRDVLTAGLDEIGVDLDKTDFLATHLHADHHGLIPDLLRPGRTASMGAIDAASMGRAHGGWSVKSPMGVYLRRSGFPPEELAESFRRHPGARFSGQMIEYAPLYEGDVIEIAGYSLEVIDTPGHTFGHISLYDRAKCLFIAGDHILGDITPNIQAWADDHDPLGLYLDSIAKVEVLDVDLCLPGHRSLIHDFQGRCRELREHHEVRGREVVDILRSNGSRNAYETAGLMTWDIRAKSWDDFPIMQRWFATGEAIAHLRWLEDLGQLQREDVGGRILYSATNASRERCRTPDNPEGPARAVSKQRSEPKGLLNAQRNRRKPLTTKVPEQLDEAGRQLEQIAKLPQAAEQLRQQLEQIAKPPQAIEQLRRQLEQMAKPLQAIDELRRGLLTPFLPTASQIASLSSVLARTVEPYSSSLKQAADWEVSLARRMKMLRTPWVLPDRSEYSLSGFARLSRLSDAVHSEEPYSPAVVDVVAEEFFESVEYDPSDDTDKRDKSAVEAGLNPELIAFPPRTYPEVVFAAGFKLRIGPTPVPRAIDLADRGAVFDPAHSPVMTELEQQLRSVVAETLRKSAGPKWAKQRVSRDVREHWERRQEEDRRAGRPVYAVVQYADFMDLADVIGQKNNWPLFQSLFRNRDDFLVSLRRLHPVRIAIAHSRPLSRADVLTLVSEAARIFSALKVAS